ncbi:MAG: type II secretion system F family protein [Planctomycetota bacterium]
MSLVTTRERTLETSADELALFHRTLADLCRAEIPLPKAFELLQSDLRRGKLRTAVREMTTEVEGGVPLGEAYAKRMGRFPPLYRALVEIGIVSGDLPSILEEISRHAAQRASVAARIRKALAYPLVAAGFVLGIGAFLVVYVAPTLWHFPQAMDLGSPLLYAQVSLGVLVALFLAAVVFGCVRAPLDGGGARAFALPVLGRLRLYAAKSSFAATLALLLRRDVPLPNALAMAAEGAENRRLALRGRTMAEQARAGLGLAEVLREDRTFAPTLLWLVEAMEGTGETAQALDDVSAIYRQRLDRAVDRVTTLVTPVAELAIGAVVFVFAYSFMVPLIRDAVGLFRL